MMMSRNPPNQNLSTPQGTRQYAATSTRMAAIMRERAEPGCTRDDLLDQGFSDGEIDRFEATARQMARWQSIRILDQAAPASNPERDEKLIEMAGDICTGLMPSEAQVVARLRARGFQNADIARLWPRIVARLTGKMERG